MKWLKKIINKIFKRQDTKVFDKADLEYQDGDNT
jgi:hypothetical protein